MLQSQLHFLQMLPMLFFDWVIALSGEETSATRTFLSSTVMRWVGDISMSFYMVHLLIWEWAVKINNNPDIVFHFSSEIHK
jgi:peptidoglycan/LPS O-acetylase OafA/YrhL